ncbi:hypothetical protein LCL89_07145 [Halobacillus yeomjeoni]|uniref:BsuPI-related putative proteinase inhibitor n=1 Tax=Halobacillus yeomjeoni TaxID=311194 RepID=UPI001CD3450A|nr:BsuPI-related putative proteinase inhibitor [Halobacillus yeomjeoni]MCA0983833.1 hypothetical protein [Halobacillus yeomjeoni]
MKKRTAIMMGVLAFGLIACGAEAEKESAEAQNKKEETVETSSNNPEPEIDVEKLIEQLSMDVGIEASEDAVSFDFSLKNTGDSPVILGFTSSQKYEIKVNNSEGDSVYTFSADKMFTQELTTEELGSGESLTATETWTNVKEQGEYEATITFLVDTINDQSLEAVPYQVTQSFTVNDENSAQAENEKGKTYGKGQAFREVTVSGENGSYVIQGEARVFEGSFLYSVEDGHNVIIEPTPVQVSDGAPAWSSFELNIDVPEDKRPDFGLVTLTLFEESSKDGKPTNVNNIPLESFPSE